MANIIQYKVAGETPCALSHYGSVAEMAADCIDRRMARPYNREIFASACESPRHGYYGGVNWYGVPTLADVKRCLREGYPEGAAKVDALYDVVAPTLPRAVDFRRQRVRGEQGDALDIHAVNRGALDKAWETVRRKARAGTGLIRIAVDIAGNCIVNAENLQWRGVAALALSRAMSKAGYSVEVVAGQAGVGMFGYSGRGVHGVTTVTVKPRNAAVDTATLAATVCLPGFFRYSGFASIIRQSDDLGFDCDSSLGRCVKLESVLPVPEKITQIVVPETVSTQATAEAWVREAVGLLQGATVDKEGGGR